MPTKRRGTNAMFTAIPLWLSLIASVNAHICKLDIEQSDLGVAHLPYHVNSNMDTCDVGIQRLF